MHPEDKEFLEQMNVEFTSYMPELPQDDNTAPSTSMICPHKDPDGKNMIFCQRLATIHALSQMAETIHCTVAACHIESPITAYELLDTAQSIHEQIRLNVSNLRYLLDPESV